VPRQSFELPRIDVPREKLVGFARVAREEPLQILGLQIAGVGGRTSRGASRISSLDDAQVAADRAKCIQGKLQLVARVRRRDDGPYARLSGGDVGDAIPARKRDHFQRAIQRRAHGLQRHHAVDDTVPVQVLRGLDAAGNGSP